MQPCTPASVAAVVAAAGLSRRMGQPKQLLPWGDKTVIESVINNLAASGADPIVCVVGHQADQVQAALGNSDPIVVQNPGYREYDLLSSYQLGIAWLSRETDERISGALLSLGDQPQVGSPIIRQIVAQANHHPDRIIIPSHRMRRGHPIILPRSFWPELLALGRDDILRTLINRHHKAIIYVNIEQDSILYDLDTPAEYARLQQAYVAGKQAE